MAALQYYSPQLADERAYYGALMGWSFFFDAEERMPVGLPADELLHRNLYYLYGIERREMRRNNFADLWQVIEESIAADRVLLAWVDARDVSDAAFQYNRTPGASEAMLIYGYEQATDMLAILVNPQGFAGQVPLSRLPEMLPELVVYDYAVPEGLDPYPVEKMEQVLLEDVREMLAGNKVGRVETGLPAAQRFVEEMERQIERDAESLRVWMREVFCQLALLGPQRQRLDDNLRRLAAATGLGALSAAADTFRGHRSALGEDARLVLQGSEQRPGGHAKAHPRVRAGPAEPRGGTGSVLVTVVVVGAVREPPLLRLEL